MRPNHQLGGNANAAIETPPTKKNFTSGLTTYTRLVIPPLEFLAVCSEQLLIGLGERGTRCCRTERALY